jgi:hypothetical protein
LKENIQTSLGYRFKGIEFKELVLYCMANNCDMFSSGMFRFREKQLYKKFLDIVEISPLGHLDASLKEYLKFHA